MKPNKRILTEQRKRLDQLIQANPLSPLFDSKPRAGWLKAIREAIGMTSQQLAKRMKLKNHGSILAFEKREKEKSITLAALEQAAKAMGCRFIYAIVPESGTLDGLLESVAQKKANQIIQRVSQSMKLENQSVAKAQQDTQIDELASDLKENLDSRLWD